MEKEVEELKKKVAKFEQETLKQEQVNKQIEKEKEK